MASVGRQNQRISVAMKGHACKRMIIIKVHQIGWAWMCRQDASLGLIKVKHWCEMSILQ